MRYGRYTHHCEDCRLIEHTWNYDYYVCNGTHGPEPGTWLLVRWGDEETDYTACRDGMAFNELLEECQRYARRM